MNVYIDKIDTEQMCPKEIKIYYLISIFIYLYTPTLLHHFAPKNLNLELLCLSVGSAVCVYAFGYELQMSQ